MQSAHSHLTSPLMSLSTAYSSQPQKPLWHSVNILAGLLAPLILLLPLLKFTFPGHSLCLLPYFLLFFIEMSLSQRGFPGYLKLQFLLIHTHFSHDYFLLYFSLDIYLSNMHLLFLLNIFRIESELYMADIFVSFVHSSAPVLRTISGTW